MFLGWENVVEEVLQEDGNHGMWGDSHVISSQASPQSSDSLVLDWFGETIEKSWVWQNSVFVLSHSHKLGLNVVKWKRNKGNTDTRNSWCCQTDCHGLLLLACILKELFFSFVVRNQLWWVDGHGSGDCGYSACPEAFDSFFLSDSDESINNVLVVSSFGLWQAVIWLESDEGNVSWVGDDWPDGTWEQRILNLFTEGKVSVFFVSDTIFEGLVDTESHSTVDELSHDSWIDSFVKSYVYNKNWYLRHHFPWWFPWRCGRGWGWFWFFLRVLSCFGWRPWWYQWVEWLPRRHCLTKSRWWMAFRTCPRSYLMTFKLVIIEISKKLKRFKKIFFTQKDKN